MNRPGLIELINHKMRDVILVSGFTQNGDEVFVEVKGQALVKLSKKRNQLGSVYGEFVGINKVSINLFNEMIGLINVKDRMTFKFDYETDGFVALAKKKKIYCHKLDDLTGAISMMKSTTRLR